MVSSILKGLVTNNGIGRYETLLKQVSLLAGYTQETPKKRVFFVWCRIFQLKLCLLLVFQMNLVLLQTMKANYG